MSMGVYRTPQQKMVYGAQFLVVAGFLLFIGGYFKSSAEPATTHDVQGRQKALQEDVQIAGAWKKQDFAKPPRMMNVVITGGAGYIGSHMALLLLDQGNYNVTVLDNLSRSSIATIKRLKKHAEDEGITNKFHWIFTELEDQKKVTGVFKAGTTDLVLHFAGNAYVGESMKFPDLYKQNITVTTQRLVNAMVAAKVPYLVYSSSCATYGNVEKLPITEDSPQKPISPYGQAKLDAEKVIKKAVKQNPGAFSAVALRYFNVVGVDAKMRTGPVLSHEAQKKYPRILDAILDVVEGKRERIEIAGDKFPTRDGTAIRDYVHVSDLVAAHLASFKAFEKGSSFEAFNIGTGTGLTVKEILTVVEKVTGKTVDKVITDARPGDASELVSSADKLTKLTGWKTRYGKVADMVTTQWEWRQKLKKEGGEGGKAA
uniref:NAD-dependent epimerase/dehydratase domain-containing protein n=1 Tax=Hemiselmis andersenii TaxID=464988 RepID=A0A6U4S9D0_HEMAN|mmetsp:Transcript_13064/g.32054  ORF Transcript_13064/g.32054 Transcript_13064/m.32054 type:complete len:428 (+) Transcript_13064:180-1463(+)